jgi:hypothetical protein
VKKKGKSSSQMSRASLPNYLSASIFPIYHAANDKQCKIRNQTRAQTPALSQAL